MPEIVVTDEAVERACRSWNGPHVGVVSDRMRVALQAAAPLLQVQAGDACPVCGGSGFATQGVPCADIWHDAEDAESEQWQVPVQVDREAIIEILTEHAVGRHITLEAAGYRAVIADRILALLSPEETK